jgi:hypothetical protein
VCRACESECRLWGPLCGKEGPTWHVLARKASALWRVVPVTTDLGGFLAIKVTVQGSVGVATVLPVVCSKWPSLITCKPCTQPSHGKLWSLK